MFNNRVSSVMFFYTAYSFLFVLGVLF